MDHGKKGETPLSFGIEEPANKQFFFFVLPKHMAQMIGKKSQVDLWPSKSTRLKLC